MPTLRFDKASLQYARAAVPALVDIDLTVSSGIVGLVGANGAGKSSLLKLLLGSARPSAGSVMIDESNPETFRRSHGMGFIPEKPTFPPHLTVDEFLVGLRALASAGTPTPEELALSDSFQLRDIGGQRLSRLSLGQKRRVELAAALIGDPPLLLLDEPTNGLDPLAVVALRASIIACRRVGRVILISSHHLDELQRLADRVIMLDHGRLVGEWDATEGGHEAGALEERFRSLVERHAS